MNQTVWLKSGDWNSQHNANAKFITTHLEIQPLHKVSRSILDSIEKSLYTVIKTLDKSYSQGREGIGLARKRTFYLWRDAPKLTSAITIYGVNVSAVTTHCSLYINPFGDVFVIIDELIPTRPNLIPTETRSKYIFVLNNTFSCLLKLLNIEKKRKQASV